MEIISILFDRLFKMSLGTAGPVWLIMVALGGAGFHVGFLVLWLFAILGVAVVNIGFFIND
jgi:hypothetical protein